jgi:hypothetical protein
MHHFDAEAGASLFKKISFKKYLIVFNPECGFL